MMIKGKAREAIKKIVSPTKLNQFFDPVAPESSLELGPPFDVATLNRQKPPLEKVRSQSTILYFGESGVEGLFGYNAKTDKLKLETELEQDLKRLGDVPEGHDYILEEEKFHPHHGFERPVTRFERRPEALDLRDEDIMTPQERRLCAEYQQKVDKAYKEIKRNKAFQDRRRSIIQKLYPNGVLGVDSALNLQSPVYEQKARILHEQRKRNQQAHSARADKIASKNISKHQRGYELLEHITGQTEKDLVFQRLEETQWLSRKGKGEFPKDKMTTFDRVFRQPVEKKRPCFGSKRYDMEKRPFNIVTGCILHSTSKRKDSTPEV